MGGAEAVQTRKGPKPAPPKKSNPNGTISAPKVKSSAGTHRTRTSALATAPLRAGRRVTEAEGVPVGAAAFKA